MGKLIGTSRNPWSGYPSRSIEVKTADDPRYDDKHELTHYSQEEMEEEMLRLNDQIQQRLKESKALLRQLRKEADP